MRQDAARSSALLAEEQSQTPAVVPPVGPGHWVSREKHREIIDLLNPEPAVVVNLQRINWALDFGFVGGATAGILSGALSLAPIAASDWDPECFADMLFVSELIDICMRIDIEGFEPTIDKRFLARLLTQPPKDSDVLEFRRAILQELAHEGELRALFNRTYRDLYRLRELFDSTKRLSESEDRTRRLDILSAIHEVIERLGNGFDGCKSGLSRIARFAQFARASAGYLRLCELLDYENHLASVDLKLRLGADGRIRRFEIVRMSENRENPFYRTPLGRFWIRLLFFFRGYMLSEVELINRWVDSIFDGVRQLLPPLIQLIGEMEFYLAALAFKELADTHRLSVSFPRFISGTPSAPARRVLRGLFNPLLFSQNITPIPCDIEDETWDTTTIVTGPNSGGKTRLLQAVGLAQMLGQCGMFAPVSEGVLNRASGLYVSLNAEARADQCEGHLGTELIRIRQLFENARYGSLIILDELCSGTNPSEGEEIFRLVVSLLRELRPCVFITTHFLQFAMRLCDESEAADGLCFLQVKLDESNCPTYRFIPGVAKTSLAQQTAARLGVTREELLALIRRGRLADPC
ncbi:MAG: DNA mismatch repair protein [Deltaproteobacteria bacterium]|nr:DNA mismatch repair protein [Deltaproteobacteria bacterium]